jgi:hypothetical protein
VRRLSLQKKGSVYRRLIRSYGVVYLASPKAGLARQTYGIPVGVGKSRKVSLGIIAANDFIGGGTMTPRLRVSSAWSFQPRDGEEEVLDAMKAKAKALQMQLEEAHGNLRGLVRQTEIQTINNCIAMLSGKLMEGEEAYGQQFKRGLTNAISVLRAYEVRLMMISMNVEDPHVPM